MVITAFDVFFNINQESALLRFPLSVEKDGSCHALCLSGSRAVWK
jgi:hypothetical protein